MKKKKSNLEVLSLIFSSLKYALLYLRKIIKTINRWIEGIKKQKKVTGLNLFSKYLNLDSVHCKRKPE